MTPVEIEPSQDELLAMAYADDQLSPESRREFEARLSSNPNLARQVSEYLSLSVLARQMAPPEPMDHEWLRLADEPMTRLGQGLGWFLFTLGGVGLGLCILVALAVSSLSIMPKLLALSLVAGLIVLFLMTVRARLRTLPFDTYRKVQR